MNKNQRSIRAEAHKIARLSGSNEAVIGGRTIPTVLKPRLSKVPKVAAKWTIYSN